MIEIGLDRVTQMMKRLCYGVLALAFIIGLSGAPALQIQGQPAPLRVLIVDETRTLLASFQVNALIITLRAMPGFSVAAQFAEVETGMEVPPLKNVTGKSFDLIVIVPRNLEELQQIWLITRPWNELAPPVQSSVQTVAQVVGKIFGSTGVHPRDVTQDLVPGWFAAIFQQMGLL